MRSEVDGATLIGNREEIEQALADQQPLVEVTNRTPRKKHMQTRKTYKSSLNMGADVFRQALNENRDPGQSMQWNK